LEEPSAAAAQPDGVRASVGEGAGRWQISHRRTGHQLKTQLSQERALGRNMTREFVPVANGTDSRARHGARPPALDTLHTILREPPNGICHTLPF
jgi:hypothetical protein